MTAAEWGRVRLRDTGDWFGGGTPSKARADYWTDGDIPWLSPKDMGAATLAGTTDRITQQAVKESSARLVRGSSMAVVVRSGILDRTLPVAVVPFDTALNQDMKALSPREDIDVRWVAWWLRSQEHRVLDTCRKRGTTVASIDTKALLDLEMPLPRLDEQRRIVDILEDHLSRLDAANALVATLEPRVDRLRARVVDAALSIARATILRRPDALGRLRDERVERAGVSRAKSPVLPDLTLGTPSTPWPVVSLEAATDPIRTIRYGILKPRTASGGSVPYVEVKDLKGNTLRGKHLNKTSSELDEQFAGARLRAVMWL